VAREKAQRRANDWNSSDVLQDPTLQALQGDPEFAAAIGAPP